jgi:hypothetical protein
MEDCGQQAFRSQETFGGRIVFVWTVEAQIAYLSNFATAARKCYFPRTGEPCMAWARRKKKPSGPGYERGALACGCHA